MRRKWLPKVTGALVLLSIIGCTSDEDQSGSSYVGSIPPPPTYGRTASPAATAPGEVVVLTPEEVVMPVLSEPPTIDLPQGGGDRPEMPEIGGVGGPHGGIDIDRFERDRFETGRTFRR